jgi:hypothetical protein
VTAQNLPTPEKTSSIIEENRNSDTGGREDDRDGKI